VLIPDPTVCRPCDQVLTIGSGIRTRTACRRSPSNTCNEETFSRVTPRPII